MVYSQLQGIYSHLDYIGQESSLNRKGFFHASAYSRSSGIYSRSSGSYSQSDVDYSRTDEVYSHLGSILSVRDGLLSVMRDLLSLGLSKEQEAEAPSKSEATTGGHWFGRE